MARVLIFGVGVQVETLLDKSFDEIEEIDIFSHLSDNDKGKALDKLFDEIELEKNASSEYIQKNSSD